ARRTEDEDRHLRSTRSIGVPESIRGQLAKAVRLDLRVVGQRDLLAREEQHAPRHLVAGQTLAEIVPDLRLVERAALARYDARDHDFAERLVRNADRAGHADARVAA